MLIDSAARYTQNIIMLKSLPYSTYSFKDIIDNNYLYVDKTQYIYQLVKKPKSVYFLSRPRRFGKSLLVSTLAEIFSGNKELFRGLWIYESDYEWIDYPVIRIDFSHIPIKSAAELEQGLNYLIEGIAKEHGLTLLGFNFQTKFQDLIRQLAQTNQVVILIDEYDKPIVDNLDDIEEAKRIRDTLKGFYSAIKATDPYLHLAFITGISKFSQVGIFSTLNNLLDLTLDTHYSSMLGLTESELRRDFSGYITQLATHLSLSEEDLLERIRHWYDGFCFAPNGTNVYNPYSVIRLFFHQHFSNYWFQSGTPTFLINLIKKQNVPLEDFNGTEIEEIGFSTYELEDLAIIPLLFQTGYLTIKDHHQEGMRETVYRLAYPNYEVETAFITYLISGFSHIDRAITRSYLRKLLAAIQADDLETAFSLLGVFFANIPYDLQLKYEQYYQSIFYTIFVMLGTEIEVEVRTNIGRIDAVVTLADKILLFEFKIDKSAEEALQQIKTNEYYQRYRLSEKTVKLIGANFNSTTRSIDEWLSEIAGAGDSETATKL